MKKIAYISILVIFLFACKEDFLEVQPKTEIASDGFYKEYDGAIRGISALYDRLGDKDDGLIGRERFVSSADIRNASGGFREFSWSSDDKDIEELWRKYYAFIAQANEIISKIQENQEEINNTLFLSELESDYIKQNLTDNPGNSAAKMLLGEARFMRAYAYFTLYRYYGAVPLVSEVQNVFSPDTKRATRDEMFEFIEADLLFALEKCLPNNIGGETVTNYGRITKGAAAGMLAKTYVFEASYIRRAEMWGSQIGEVKGSRDKNELYTKALKYCNDLINSSTYGDYQLTEFYPAIFTKANKEILFGMIAEEGYGLGSDIASNWGIDGDNKYGGRGGSLTSLLPMLYDLPTWEHNSRVADLYWDFGQIDSDVHQPGENPVPSDTLARLYHSLGAYTLTGDNVRRTWNSIKATITGEQGVPQGMWITEPWGKFMPDFYIEPGKGLGNYSADEEKVLKRILATHEIDNWKSSGDTILWNVRFWQFAKFRQKPPQNITNDYDSQWSGVDYPILRLGEIYLLKAEALLFSGNVSEAINAINVVRDRACFQGDLNDMYLNQGDASYSYVAGAVTPIPTSLPIEQAKKELLFERVRELCGEDDCRWLDAARFPDIVEYDYKDISEYSDPLHHMRWYRDDRLYYRVNDRFNSNDIHRVLWPIPQREFKYFPNMRQNSGY